jgi:hypothetical protein
VTYNLSRSLTALIPSQEDAPSARGSEIYSSVHAQRNLTQSNIALGFSLLAY